MQINKANLNIMNTIEIKKINLEDLVELQQIGKQTFDETFRVANSDENMETYLDESFSTQKLTIELENPESEFYFALFEGEVIGYLKINIGSSQTELKDENGFEIERIYVKREFHGKKVGQILFEKAVQLAQQKNKKYVWLGVWEENHKAIGFYTKNGFVTFDKHIFHFGKEKQTDLMMKLTFN